MFLFFIEMGGEDIKKKHLKKEVEERSRMWLSLMEIGEEDIWKKTILS